MSITGIRGVLVSDKEAKEIDRMFLSMDNLGKRKVKNEDTEGKMYSRAERPKQSGRVQARPVLRSRKERQRQERKTLL